MAGFRGPVPIGQASPGIAGADLSNAPSGTVPFTSPFGLPVTRMQTWHAGGVQPGAANDGVPGKKSQRASGNPDVATTAYAKPQPYGGGPVRPALPQFGNPRPLGPDQESDKPRQPPVGSENDQLITYDRHGFFKSGYENSGRGSGQTDPPSDGPARPSFALVQRTISWQQGTDNTANQDDKGRPYSRTPNGQYLGEQGNGWSPVYGGTPGLWQPYGSYEGITNGPVHGIQSPVGEGANGDGPHKVWSGPPHGLHSPTLPSYDQTIGRYMATPQMSQPRQDRPSNSPIAGQSYSQTVTPQGQTGTIAAGTGPGGTSGAARNLVKPWQLLGNGWRGHA
jgi:hypothetical protein